DTPLPQGDLDIAGRDQIVTVSPQAVEKARQVFEKFSGVTVRTVTRNKREHREMEFPSVPVGMIRSRAKRGADEHIEIVACKTVLLDCASTFEFKVNASNCLAFYVPSIFSKLAKCQFDYITIEGLGGTERDRNLPASLAENNNPAKILQAA